MKIKSLELNNFKRFQKLKLDFKDGINVITGPNEAGKSTITRAILDAFFADPATRSKQYLDEIFPWNKAQETNLTLNFEAEGNEYSLSKDFYKKEMSCKQKASGAEVRTQKELNAVLAKFTNIPSREIFLSTAFIRQSDLISSYDNPEFVSALQDVASSGGTRVNVPGLVQAVNAKLRGLRIGLDHPAKNPGKLKLVAEQIAQLTAELAEKKAAWEKVRTAAEDSKGSGSELAEIQTKIADLETLLANYRIFQDASKELTRLDKEIADFERKLTEAADVQKGVASAESSLKQYKLLASIDLEQASTQIARLQQLIKISKQQLAAVPETITVTPSSNVVSKAVAYLVAVVILIVPLAIDKPIWYLLALPAALGLVWALQRNAKMDPPVKPEDDKKVSSLAEQGEKAREELSELLTNLGLEKAADFYTAKASYHSDREQLNELQAQLKGILAGSSFDELKSQQISLLTSKKELEVNKLTEAVRNAELSPEKYLRTTRELDELYLRKKDLETKQVSAKVRLEDAEVSSETIVELEERLDVAQSEQQYWQRKERVLELTAEALDQAVESVSANAGALVSAEIENYLSQLTEGRYKSARLTDTMQIEIFSDEKNEWINPVSVLSTGTVDQIYLLGRIAFVKVLCKDKTVPLIFDDPFVTFDSKRKQLLQKILTKLSESFQIVILSHDLVYKGWGDMINLDIQNIKPE